MLIIKNVPYCCKYMEVTWLFPTLVILVITLTFLHKIFRSKTPKLPPGPTKLPIIGNLHNLAFTSNNDLPHRALAELASVYGPIMHLTLGEVPTVVVSSADMAKEVLKTHDSAICSRPEMMLPEVLFYNRTDIGFAPYGDYWRHVRKIAVLELFTAKRVKGFRYIREGEVSNLISSLALQAGSVVNLTRKIFGLTFDITFRLGINEKGKDREEFRSLIKEIAIIASGFSICDLYPSMKFLQYITGTKRKIEETVKRSDGIMNPIIEEHMSQMRQGKMGEDLVDVLLTYHKDNPNRASDFFLTTNNIKAIVLELFGAGSETSSSALVWAMSELIKNPRVMEKALKEVRQVFNKTENVIEANLDQLKYLKLIIKETLRLHPPLCLLLPRECMEKCEINCYEILPKTRVLINAWAIGRDPNCWKDPEIFNPERFEGSSVDYKGTDFELTPFGGGRRMCPGLGLGIANVELPLANLLYHFNWALPDNITPDEFRMDEAFGMGNARKFDLNLIPMSYVNTN